MQAYGKIHQVASSSQGIPANIPLELPITPLRAT